MNPGNPDLEPCHDGDFLTVDVRVSISTADERVTGSFVTAAGPGEWGGFMLHSAQPGGLVTHYAVGDASSFLGTLALGPVHAEAPFLEAELHVITGPQFDPRVDLTLRLGHHVPKGSERVRYNDDYAALLPSDGCNAVRFPHSGPISSVACQQPAFGDGCCVLGHELFARRDEDAGSPE